MLRSRANEIQDLVQRLRSRRRACVDGARARLAIIGPRAVEDLIEALEGDDDRIRTRVMPLLALIQDSRGRGPLIAMLLDQSARLRGIAARSLARFPSPDAVAGLARLLRHERSHGVALAAIQALVEQYAAGQDTALRAVLELLDDRRAPAPRRVAALDLLTRLRPAERATILGRLRDDPDPAVSRAACDFEATRKSESRGSDEEVRTTLAALGSSDYAAWNQAVQRLASRGREVIAPLVAEMQCRAHDPEYCKRAGMALKALGARRAQALTGCLEQIDEPLPLQVLVEVIGALGEKSLIYRLKDLIDRLSRRPTHPADANGWDPMQRVRAKAHLELAHIGSRVAIGDLHKALCDSDRRLEIELLMAIELIGKRDEILLLVRAWGREDDFMKRRIADAVRSILRRERIRRNNPMFRAWSRESLRALDEIRPQAVPRGTAGRRADARTEPLPELASRPGKVL